MIEITGLSKTYGRSIHALQNVDLCIETGMFGLLGPNGAGKTTLMRIMAGLLRPTSGKVSVWGNDLATLQGKQAAKALLGYLPQELGLYPNLTAREFLDYVAILKGITERATRHRQIDEMLDTVRLIDVAERKLSTFSGGMKQRVGIAQALLGSPRFLIVDEPTAGLDPEERVRLRNLLADVARTSTVILSTHIIDDISQSCNALAVIAQGRVLFRGSPRQLMEQMQNQIWTIQTSGEIPQGVQIISTLITNDCVQYRVIGSPSTDYRAIPAVPSLEDAYIGLMQRSKTNG